MKLKTGKDYPNLCEVCQGAISDMHMYLSEGGPDVGDDEAPLMLAGDRGMMCGGSICVNSPEDEGKSPWHIHAASDGKSIRDRAFLWAEDFETREEAMTRAESAARQKAVEIGGEAHIYRSEGLGWGAYPPKLAGACYFYDVWVG